MCGVFFFHHFSDRQVFCDFGNNFVVSDVDGEQPLSCIIADIEKVCCFFVVVVVVVHHLLFQKLSEYLSLQLDLQKNMCYCRKYLKARLKEMTILFREYYQHSIFTII